MDEIKRLQEMVDECGNIVFFGGAGVSTESGIPDFRSADGIYSREYGTVLSPETLVSHRFFVNHPNDFYDFYRNNLIFPDVRPNKAHKKLAELEQAGKVKAVVTQNIDGLHQAAGSKTVYELHGSVSRNYCVECGKPYDTDVILNSNDVPRCQCGGIIRPDVVLFEERLDESVIAGAVKAIEKADMLIVAGSSLVVYPAAGFVDYFRGKYLVLINLSETSYDSKADLVIHGKVGEVLDQIKC